MVGSIVQHGTSSFIVDVSTVSENSISYSFSPIAGGTTLLITTPYTAQECGLLSLDDGVQMGWMVIAVWIAVFALLFVTRAFRGETGDSYGNA